MRNTFTDNIKDQLHGLKELEVIDKTAPSLFQILKISITHNINYKFIFDAICVVLRNKKIICPATSGTHLILLLII